MKKNKQDKEPKAPKMPTASVQDLTEALSNMVSTRMNMITGKIEVRWITDQLDAFAESRGVNSGNGEFGKLWHDLTDREENTLYLRCAERWRCRLSDISALLRSDFTPQCNPLREYLMGLVDFMTPPDGKDYIAELAAHVHVKAFGGQSQEEAQREWTECLRRWLVGTVASVMDDGVVNETVLALIGEQGAYKSTFFRLLLPEEMRRYFFVKTDNAVLSKDDRLQLTRNWLICLEEIDALSNKELNQLKAMITMREIQDRPAYARNFVQLPHVASLCATGNNEQFLSDPTGSRRWLPFLVDSIDDPNQFDYQHNRLFGQALGLYVGKYRYWFERQEIERQNIRNQKFEVTNLEEELIQRYYAVPKEGQTGIYVSTSEILLKINSGLRQNLSTMKIGRAMKKLKFEPKKTKTGMKYYVLEQGFDDMERIKRSGE